MEEKICFQSEVHYDLATHKEFQKISVENHLRTTMFGLLYVGCMVYLLSSLSYSFTAKSALALSLFSLCLWLFQWYRNRDGGIDYKRILRSNNCVIPHDLITLDENGITRRNLSTEKEISVEFSSIREILETKNLLILVDDLRIGHIIDKSTLTGGSRDALVSFLRKSCPKIKKRVRTGRFGRMVRYLMYSIAIFSLLASLAVLLHIPEKLTGQITNDMTYEEMAAQLAELDILIDPAVIEELKQYDGEYSDFLYPDYPKVMNLLSLEGMGRHDYDTWEWTPSTSGVYWFDTEVMDAGAIYTNFLRGVDAMNENLTFSNVTEDYSSVDMESGMGIVTVSFDYLGKSYSINAQYEYDWFDTNMLTHLGRILKADSDLKDLWYTFDGQGVLLYYGTVEQVLALEQKTGLYFLDPCNNPLYS